MKLLRIVVAAALAAPLSAFATMGYFAHGYGLKAKGMGGVGIALPQEVMSGATNPANLGFVGNRMDVELEWFRPIRDGEIVGNATPPFGPGRSGNYDASGRKNFLIPGFGYNRMIRPDLSVGIVVYGNGGMNTTFRNNPFGGFMGGSTEGGVDYMQLFVAPTIAWKPNDNHSIGVSLNLVYQQFGAQGLEGFQGFSQTPGNVTNRGRDDSTGIGLRVGWTGKVSSNITLGAMYQPKTNMGKLGDYAGLFRSQGDLDIPATLGVGIAVKATPQLTIAGDIQRIDYAKVPAIGTSPDCLIRTGTCQLGASNGPGFGWRNMTSYKVGVAYEVSRSLTVRAGFATGKQPIPNNQTLLNMIFPAVMEDHVTLGATWSMGTMEFTAGYMHALKRKVNGAGSIPAGFGGGEANLKMYQDALGVAVGWKM
jgi:long-chain fatty acid transport protein